MKDIIYTNQDGGVTLVGAASISDLRKIPQFENMTQAEYEAHVWERAVPKDAINPQYIDEIPEDWHFRDAWKQNGKTAIVDMDKAKEIHMEKILMARNVRLKELEQRQYGPEFDKERQDLLDIPQTFVLTAKTPEELKALWPEELKEK